ncbi:MAG: sigma-70 family RNA polymerase sigma factor [Gammaproteobacteria bacterium]
MSSSTAASHGFMQEQELKLAALLQSITQRDNEAFRQFYDDTVGRVYALALRITRKPQAAEEVVCDVYLQVWNQASRFDAQRGSALAWLMTLSRSRALDAIRRDPPQALNIDDHEVAAEGGPQDLLQSVTERSALHAALKKLDENQRQLLALAYFKGYSHSELAQFTGLPLGTVKTLIRRGILALRGHMNVETEMV